MKTEIVNLQLKGDQVKNVIGILERYEFDSDDIGDKLDEAFSMYLFGEDKGGASDFGRAHWVHGAIVDAKLIIRAIAEVAKDAKIQEIEK